MNRDEYKAINSGQGAQVREIFTMATNRGRPSRSQVEEALDDAGIVDPGTRKAIFGDVVDLAQRTRDGGNQFHLRQEADDIALGHVKKLAARDDLFGEEPTYGPSNEDQQHAEAIAADLTATDKDIAELTEQANAVERARHGIAG